MHTSKKLSEKAVLLPSFLQKCRTKLAAILATVPLTLIGCTDKEYLEVTLHGLPSHVHQVVIDHPNDKGPIVVHFNPNLSRTVNRTTFCSQPDVQCTLDTATGEISGICFNPPPADRILLKNGTEELAVNHDICRTTHPKWITCVNIGRSDRPQVNENICAF